MPPNLYGLDRAALAAHVSQHGAPAFHGRQIYRWLYAREILDPRRWTDLPVALRSELAAAARIDAGRIDARLEAADGTVKYRIAASEGDVVEAVSMVQRGRVTLCLSSQVGCALDCDFCLTGKMGLVRHLTVGEILGQVALIVADGGLHDRRFNLVFMGMGEPLHNYDAVVGAVRTLCDPEGFGLSRQRVTVSTVGLVPAIERLSREPLRPRLAVSLNATTDEVRARIMPVNRRYPLDRLLEACRDYTRRTDESVTFEYVVLHGVNDSDDDVRRLGRLLRAHRAKLNLIPFNPVPGILDYRPASRDRVREIRDRLLHAGLRASIRWSRGAEARAACGQLALLAGEPGAEMLTTRSGRKARRSS